MEQLEVKHLAPYLPYDLMTDKGKLVSIQNVCISVQVPILKFEVVCDKYDVTEQIIKYPDIDPSKYRYEAALISEVKPILRPVSDLAMEHCFNPRWKFIFEDYEVEYYASDTEIILDFTSNSDPELFHHPIVQRLFEHHFDVFGLINKGLAIKYIESPLKEA